MDLQELSYYVHVKYCLERKEAAQIKIRRWYQFLHTKTKVRIYIYTGSYFLKLAHRYILNDNYVFFKPDNDDAGVELVFSNKNALREYILRLLLSANTCFFIHNDTYDNIFLIQ